MQRADVFYESSPELKAVFQPIVDLQTGRVAGFEVLARLSIGGVVVPPVSFIPHLDAAELLSVFCRMTGMGLDFLRETKGLEAGSYVSVNVELNVLLLRDFIDIFAHLLDRRDYQGGLVLEILEGQRVEDVDAMRAVLARVSMLGVGIALDDIGSAYSSLARIRDLPVDIVKLDQTFARGLERRPEDMMFMMSVAALARGLGKRLVVEGVETEETIDALTILGIELVQGYAIARPLSPAAVASWLADRPALRAHRMPRSLLGAYASHLNVVETCRSLAIQPLEIDWREAAKDWRGCGIGRLFTEKGLHNSRCGRAHAQFHDVLDRYSSDHATWERACAEFRCELVTVISEETALNAKVALASH